MGTCRRRASNRTLALPCPWPAAAPRPASSVPHARIHHDSDPETSKTSGNRTHLTQRATQTFTCASWVYPQPASRPSRSQPAQQPALPRRTQRLPPFRPAPTSVPAIQRPYPRVFAPASYVSFALAQRQPVSGPYGPNIPAPTQEATGSVQATSATDVLRRLPGILVPCLTFSRE